ncbi:mandelate racemase/muconate lactonizing enzyme family protein [Elioraea sp.]|uniref:mandelate racemase/muconate lactonizing enzyme family protein n=1 Tax=Elioraea sp. TaxID=2185103 RepID=UPI003F7093DA
MARITDIRLVAVQHHLGAGMAYGMARGLTALRGAGIVLLETDAGVQGIGEAWGPSTVARAYLDLIRPYFIDTSVFGVRAVAQGIFAKHYHFGTQNQMIAALSGIDIAAHDAMGKLFGVPVSDLIGGRQRDRVPVYCSGGYFTEQDDHLAALSRQLEPHVESGFPAFKIKLGRRPDEDAVRARLARSIIGDRALLTVDVNGNYTVDAALESMRRMADADVHWVEEPLAPQDWSGYADLARRAPIPVATGEALYTLFDFRRLIDGRLAAILQPDLALCGGLDVARTVGILAGAEHLRVSPHCWGTGVGLAAAVHWVASLPTYPHGANVPYPALVEYDVGANPLRDELFVEPLRFENGHLHVPTGPGLGVTLNPEALKRFAVD